MGLFWLLESSTWFSTQVGKKTLKHLKVIEFWFIKYLFVVKNTFYMFQDQFWSKKDLPQAFVGGICILIYTYIYIYIFVNCFG